MIKRIEIENSSRIKVITFENGNNNLGTMKVIFVKKHSTYEYYDVPEDIYNTLKVASVASKTKSKSVGSLFNELVEKGGYRYKKLS